MNLRHNVTAIGHMSHDPSNIMTCERNVAGSLVNEMCCNLWYQLCIFKRNTPMGFNWCFDCVDKEKKWFVFTFSNCTRLQPSDLWKVRWHAFSRLSAWCIIYKRKLKLKNKIKENTSLTLGYWQLLWPQSIKVCSEFLQPAQQTQVFLKKGQQQPHGATRKTWSTNNSNCTVRCCQQPNILIT